MQPVFTTPDSKPVTAQGSSGSASPTPATTPVTVQKIVQPAIPVVKRPISISIHPAHNKPATNTPKVEEAGPDIVSELSDELYSQEAFEKAWKSYAARVTDLASAASYIQSNLPVRLEVHTYELVFSNIFQENEIKRLLNSLSQHMRTELRNSSIAFTTRVVEATEIPQSDNPEEVLRKMIEENPALELLKNNLKLEID